MTKNSLIENRTLNGASQRSKIKAMKLVIILFILTSCYSPKLVEWRVTEYKKEGERWIVTAKSARGTEKFITDCKPDSVGSRFLAKPKSIKN